MDELLEILRKLHADVDYEKEDKLIDNMILDSFDIVTLIAEINDKFGVKISAEYLVPENFNSAKALWELIEELED
ncbi:MAG: acyl carrier protein [Parasporobacterium sp.]|nr:acyl carrier protein [Parasporobacterium sp.]